MEEKLYAVISTREEGEAIEKFAKHVEETCGCDIDVIVAINHDAIGLTEVYNRTTESQNLQDKIVVYMHDDIEFLRNGWGAEILRLFKENEDYGIIGVAGSAEFNKDEAAWWRYKKIFGQVLHKHEGKSWLTAFSPLLDHDLEEVCVIDGLFMAVHNGRCTQKWDVENFKGFQFYDIAFCLDNYLDGVKVGVTTNIRIAHKSVGELKPEWYHAKDDLMEKYKDILPVSIKKNNKENYGRKDRKRRK